MPREEGGRWGRNSVLAERSKCKDRRKWKKEKACMQLNAWQGKPEAQRRQNRRLRIEVPSSQRLRVCQAEQEGRQEGRSRNAVW